MSDERKELDRITDENSQRTALENSIKSIIDLKTSREQKRLTNTMSFVHYEVVEEHHRKE